MHKFLQHDLDYLLQKRRDLLDSLRKVGQDMGEANSQSSETWHDNAPLDIAQREFERIQSRISEIDELVRNAVIVSADESAQQRVSIGSEVTYADQDGNEKSVRIGSHTPAENSGSISYLSPLAKLLIGSEVGDVIEGKMRDRKVEITIIKIDSWISNIQ